MKKVSWLLVLVMVFSMIAIGAVAEADKSAVSGEVNVYMASTEDFALAIKEGFEAAYPNITMNYVLLGGGEILTRLRAEIANPQADIVYGGACDNYMIMKDEGLLQAYQSPNTEGWEARNHDSDFFWTGWVNAYLGFYCDQDWFDANGVALPTSWNDLLDERLKDNVVITNPGTSTTGYMMLSTLCQLMGEEEALTYYAKLNENIKTYATGGSGPSNSVALGEAAVGVGYIQFGIQLAEQGYHLSISMPEEGTGLEISAEGVVAGCKNLEAAQCLMDFLTSVEGQQLAEASGLYVFPCNPNAHISEKITQYEGTKLVDLDYQWSAANRDRLVEAWDALISK